MAQRAVTGGGRNFIAGYTPGRGNPKSRNLGFDTANVAIERNLPSKFEHAFGKLRSPGAPELTPDERRMDLAMQGLRQQAMPHAFGAPAGTPQQQEMASINLQELEQQQAAGAAARDLNTQWQGDVGRELPWSPYGDRDAYTDHGAARFGAAHASQLAAGRRPAMGIQVPGGAQQVAPSQQQLAKRAMQGIRS